MTLRTHQKVLFQLIFLLIFSSCGDRYKTVHEQEITINKDDLKSDSVLKDSSNGNFYTRLTQPVSFGRTFKYALNEEQEGKGFYIVFSGRAKSNYAQSNGTISVSIHDKDNEQLGWFSVFLKNYFTEKNVWCHFKDSVKIEPVLAGKKHKTITCMVFLAASTKEVFDLDSLYVVIKEKV